MHAALHQHPQPYARLIVNGHMDIENQSWSTKFRGRILIHAGKKYSRREQDEYAEDLLEDVGIRLSPFEEMLLGGTVGSRDHWHHVIKCLSAAQDLEGLALLRREIGDFQKLAVEEGTRVLLPSTSLPNLSIACRLRDSETENGVPNLNPRAARGACPSGDPRLFQPGPASPKLSVAQIWHQPFG